MVIMSADQSTRKSGWSIFKDGEYLCSGVVDLSDSELDTDARSFEMAKKLCKVIKKYEPQELIIENVQQQSSVATVITLARLQGMIIGYAEAHGVKTHILMPSQWRKALEYEQGPKVKRAELKKQSLEYVKQHFGFKKCEDENEAICINVAAHKIYNFSGEEDIWGEK